MFWSDDRLYSPFWQQISPNGRIFTTHSSRNDAGMELVSEIIVTRDGMEVVSTKGSGGSAPAHLVLSADGRFLMCANYRSGDFSVFRLERDGIGEMIQQVWHRGSGSHPTRQSSAHIHQITCIPDFEDYFCVVDLGMDALMVYHQRTDGKLIFRYSIPVPAGQGPRHVTYTKTGRAYLLTELSNRIYPVCFDKDGGSIDGSDVSTLRSACPNNTSAAIWLSSDDRMAWVSNRGEGTIVGYALPNLEKRAEYTMMGTERGIFAY